MTIERTDYYGRERREIRRVPVVPGTTIEEGDIGIEGKAFIGKGFRILPKDRIHFIFEGRDRKGKPFLGSIVLSPDEIREHPVVVREGKKVSVYNLAT